MKKYPRIRTESGKILVIVELPDINSDGEHEETTDWYSLKEIRQILKEQREEEKIKTEDTEDCEYDCDAEECLATDCPRYGKCVFTKDKG